MIIKESSTIEIKVNDDLIETLIAQEDIKIKGDGKGYLFILRDTKCEENAIVESYSIIKKDEKFIVNAYWQDAILAITNENQLHKSYLEYDV